MNEIWTSEIQITPKSEHKILYSKSGGYSNFLVIINRTENIRKPNASIDRFGLLEPYIFYLKWSRLAVQFSDSTVPKSECNLYVQDHIW